MMKIVSRQLHHRLTAIATLAALLASLSCGLHAHAADTGRYAGAGALLDPKATVSDLPASAASTVSTSSAASATLSAVTSAVSGTDTADNADAPTAEPEEEKEESNLVMADVNEVMNVRKEPSKDAEKIGVLYKDCGGTVLEKKDGWTKIQSGDLIGWASNDYLVFGKEAEAMARDVGMSRARVTTDSLRIRKSPDTEGGIYDLAAKGSTYELVEPDDGSGFVKIDYKGKDAYLSADYVEVEFDIDHGETLEAIKEREAKEAALKAKLTANQGAVQTSQDETRLLAALIQCESGNQPYEGQLGVGAVVMNRVRSAAYPSTITSVIYASGQFGPAATGAVADVYNGTVKDSCLMAAQAAIAGQTTVGSAVHFRRVGSHEGIVIGGHVFW